MRALSEVTPPIRFKQWMKANKNVSGLNYSVLSGAPKNDLKNALLQNQGFLCAYTELRLDAEQDCHIEHLVPQAQAPQWDLKPSNLLACFPADGGNVRMGYGAPVKGGTFITLGQDFLSPYTGITSQTFSFDSEGHMVGNHPAAQETIKRLQLNHPSLKELRQRAIQVHGLSLRKRNIRSRIPQAKPLSASQARALAQRLALPNDKGQHEPFCTALAQVAEQYAQQEEQRAKRLKKRKQR